MTQPTLAFLASNLMDTRGVRGIVIEDKSSKTVATMLDDIYQNLNLEEFRQQKLAVEGVFIEAANKPEDMFLRFEDAGLYLRQSEICALSVLTDSEVNIPSLRIASKLMLRQVTKQSLEVLRQSAVESDASSATRSFKAVTPTESAAPKVNGAPVSPTGLTKPIFYKPIAQPFAPPVNQPKAPVAAAAPKAELKPAKAKPKSSGGGGIWG